MTRLDDISEVEFSDLSSADRNEALHEHDLLSKEINCESMKQYQDDPESKAFGDEFSEITASGYGRQFRTTSTRDQTKTVNSTSTRRVKFEGATSEAAASSHAKTIASDDEEGETKTPFESYFSDPKFTNIPVESMPPRSLVKYVLKSGTGMKIKDIIGNANSENRRKEAKKEGKQSGDYYNLPIKQEKYESLSAIRLGLKVSFHYAGYFEFDGAPFDSTQARGEPWKEIIGVGKMIPALEHAVLEMRKNEKAVIMARYTLCYGHNGCGQRIPRQADVMFKVWLDNYNELTLIDQFLQLNHTQRIQGLKAGLFSIKRIQKIINDESSKVKEQYFMKNLWSQAQQEYSKLLHNVKCIPLLDDETQKIVFEMSHRYLNNMALCANHRARYRQAAELMEQALKLEHTPPKLRKKSLYIMGKSYRLRQYFELAKKYYNQVLEIDPGNTEVLLEMQLLKRDKDRERAASESIWKRAIDGLENARIDNDDTESSCTVVAESANTGPTPTSSTLTPGAQRAAECPEFVDFVDDFIRKFKKSSKTKINVPRDRRYSPGQLLYFSDTADRSGLDANMMIDEDGEQALYLMKL